LSGCALSGHVGIEKVSFNQLNRKTGHRIKYAKVDADTGEEVANEDIVKGYKVDTDTFIEVTKEELENVALDSTRTIEIDEFVDRSEIDPRYLIRPYYLVPDGKVGHDAFAVVRETIREMNKVAIGRVVLTNREHINDGARKPPVRAWQSLLAQRTRQVLQHGPASFFGLSERFKGRAADPDGAPVLMDRTPRCHIAGRSVKAGTAAALTTDRERKAVAARGPYFHVLDGINDAGELHGHFHRLPTPSVGASDDQAPSQRRFPAL
jgi:hypothetical protein